MGIKPRAAVVASLLVGLAGFAGPAAGAGPTGGPHPHGAAAPIAPPVLLGVSVAEPQDAAATADPAAPTGPAAQPPARGADLDADAVADAVGPILRGGALGRGRTPAHVVDVATGAVLFRARNRPTTPASTVKLVTAVSVLRALGADATLTTRTLILDPQARVPRVVLVGGGDPSLATSASRVGGSGTSLRPATLRRLARRTARALRSQGVDRVRIGYDSTLFPGPSLHSSWSPTFPAAGIVAPVSALQVDQGRAARTALGRVADPALSAARTFAEALRDAGITVTGSPRSVRERAGSVALGAVESPAVGVLVERMLGTSDNDYAEALARVAAVATGHPGSFEGVAARAEEVLASLRDRDPDDRVVDGSGLSRQAALAPGTVTSLLRVAAGPGLGSLGSGLPVAGATGSLRQRFAAPSALAGRGVVRAKTGTLTGVLGLAGYASRPDGRLLAFAFLDDSVSGAPRAARAALDRAAAALAACDCAVP